MMERAGFEPAKPEAADLQSAGFDRSPTSPYNNKMPAPRVELGTY